MRKIIGIGETVFDIIFRGDTPVSGKPGGSVFNAMVSLGRMGFNPVFISELGDDKIGAEVRKCMEQNNISDQCICQLPPDCKSAMALAFLDQNQKADYMFYNNYPDSGRLDFLMPQIEEDDIVLFGSSFAVDEALRDPLMNLLTVARDKNAIVYYDVNFRKNLVNIVRHKMPALLENMEYATIIKGSDEDFSNIYAESDPDVTYSEHIEFFTRNFIYTRGAEGCRLYSNQNPVKDYAAKAVEAVSTVGAGDSFNAGIIFGLMHYGVTFRQLKEGRVDAQTWDKIINCGVEFSSHVCTTLDNYISPQFAQQLKLAL